MSQPQHYASTASICLYHGLKEHPSTVAYNAYFDDLASPYDYRWAAGYMNRLKELNIVGGCGYRAYCPSSYMTKGSTAVFLSTAWPD